MPLSTPLLAESGSAICLMLVMLVPLAGIGITLINCGLGRSRSAAHMMLASLCVVAVAVVVFTVWGFSLQGDAAQAGGSLWLGKAVWRVAGAEPLLLRGLPLDGSTSSLNMLLRMFATALVALIPLGAMGERWRLGACCLSTVVLTGVVYPLFAHWVWSWGWLAQLGANYGLGHGFVDGGGSGVIQVVGGATALSLTWILGPRHGKYMSDGMPAAIPGHNVVYVLFGCLLAWVGWIGLNAAGAILFFNIATGRVPLVAINTTLSAAVAGLAAVAITGKRFGRPDASISGSGWMGGLVASSAGAAFVRPAAAILIGFVAGVLVSYAVDALEFRLGVDDPGGAVSVHMVGGLWGVSAVALFGNFSESGQWLAQIVGIATLLGFVLPLSYGLNWLLNRFYPQRVDAEGERQGMDLHELGSGAYPDFVTHSDEFMR